ncbi:MAG: hypothetical protein ABWK00_00865 [Desulfurococcaceae archaeon]
MASQSFGSIAGSDRERDLVEGLRATIEESSDWVKVIDVPVRAWFQEECVIEFGEGTLECLALPYTVGSATLDGAVAVQPGDLVEGSIAFAPLTYDEFGASLTAAALHGRGVRALVFYDDYPGRRRVLVVTGAGEPTSLSSSPPPIPVLSVRKEDYMRLVKRGARRVTLTYKSRLEDSRGLILLAGVNGREGEIHVVAHHDGWFGGYSDSRAPLAILAELARALRGLGRAVTFASYTASEIGSPMLSPIHWGWGSRYLLSQLDSKGLLESVSAALIFDYVFPKPIIARRHPAAAECAEGFTISRSIGGFHDEFSYALHGIPYISFNSWSVARHLYHTDADDGGEIRPHELALAKGEAERVVRCLGSLHVDSGRVARLLADDMRRLPAEAKALLAKLAGAGAGLRALLRASYSYYYLDPPGILELGPLAELQGIAGLMDELERLEGRARLLGPDGRAIFDGHLSPDGAELARAVLAQALLALAVEYDKKLSASIPPPRPNSA